MLEFPPTSQHELLLLVSGKMSQRLTSLSLTSKGPFPAKSQLSNEKIHAIFMQILILASEGHCHNRHSQSVRTD